MEKGGIHEAYTEAATTFNKNKTQSNRAVLNKVKPSYTLATAELAASKKMLDEKTLERNNQSIGELPWRVQRFVDFVNRQNIEPFTQYAKDFWPALPGEFFADAYMLCLLEPEFVKTHYPPVYEFFEKGQYR
jgi:hypothetical protein